MRKIQLGIWSTDADYSARVSAYIRGSGSRERFAPVCFTDLESCISRIRAGSGLDIFLADECLVTNALAETAKTAGCKLLRLSESGITDGERVGKYQPVDRLLDEAVMAADLEPSTGRAGPEGKSVVLSVYAAAGGSGKSVFAYTAAGLLARMGYRPLVVSLESVPSPWWCREEGGDAFGRALYYSGKEGENGPRIDRCLTANPHRRTLLLPASGTPEELEQMTAEDTVRFIEALAASGKADTVILDLDSTLAPRTRAALCVSDRVICLVPDHAPGRYKTRQVFDRLDEIHGGDKRRNISFLLNMCGGAPSEPGGSEEWEAEEALPYEKEWQNLSLQEDLDRSTLYQERVFKWLTGLMKRHARITEEGDMRWT